MPEIEKPKKTLAEIKEIAPEEAKVFYTIFGMLFHRLWQLGYFRKNCLGYEQSYEGMERLFNEGYMKIGATPLGIEDGVLMSDYFLMMWDTEKKDYVAVGGTV